MGVIIKTRGKVIVRLTVGEVLTTRVFASKDVSFTLAEMVWKFAQMKAQQKGVELPNTVIETSFDQATGEFVVVFSAGLD